MAPSATSRKSKPVRVKTDAKSLKRKRAVEDYGALEVAVSQLDPKTAQAANFADLPLSGPTASGIEASHFKILTDIQSKAIPFALKKRDVLGAAKTGSGKTLAFLVPVLENLYRQKWSELDGLGALIISPTRELAIQIFEVLRKIGRFHTFSAGLVIGGRSLQEERERLGRMNILVCTPGRMLQHMDQTAAFEVDNLQMLVLDEADRIMDMGFQSSVDAILEHLPKERQTILFSATQTRKVSDLARLSLRDPEYIAVHEAASTATPSKLQQHYIITTLSEKLNTLFSFIRSNLKAKMIVFVSSGKQVRFIFESFRRMQPGIPLLHLHGRQNQTARLDVTSKFSNSRNACLFATDVVARGLDFPAVDWVIQLDCPEDADTYIHRVGRTARYEREGRAVLFMDPSEEEGMLQRLGQKKVPIEKINVRQKKQQSIQSQLQNMCFQDPELKYLGQKAFISYTRSIYIQKDKDVFKLKNLDLEGFAASIGLPGAPKIKFQIGDDAKKLKNASRVALDASDEDIETDGEAQLNDLKKKAEVRTKYDRMFERRNHDVLSGHYSKLVADDEISNDQADADHDEDFLAVKRVLSDREGSSENENNATSMPRTVSGIGKDPIIIDSKRREKLLKSKKKLLKLKGKGNKLVFDDDGNSHEIYELEDEADFRKRGPADSQRARFVEEEASKVKEADIMDKQLAKEKKREKREKRKTREVAERRVGEDEAPLLADAGEQKDPLALLASLPLSEDKHDGPPQKRPKKWFEDDDDAEEKEHATANGHKRRTFEAAAEPETLEDLEALASGLLG